SGGIPAGSPSCLHDFREAPALRLGQRARLHDADDVADVRGVLLVVSVELHAPPDDLLVALVRGDQVDLDDDRLVHRARDHDAAALLAPAAIVLGLRLADDRLPLRARRRAAARLRRPQAARDALPLLLRLGLRRRSGFRFGRGLFGRGLFSCGLFGRRRSLLRSRFLGGGLLCSGFLDGGLFRSRLFRGGLLGGGLLSCRLLGHRLLGHRLLGGGLLSCRLPGRGVLNRSIVLAESCCPARRSASWASGSGTPASSNIARPGLTTRTQPSGEPLPEPMRVSAGYFVKLLSGKTLIHTLPPRLILRVIAIRAASIWRFVIQPASIALSP